MEKRLTAKRAVRLLWPVFLGLGLIALLALALAPRSSVEAQVAKPDSPAEQGLHESADRDGSEVRSFEIAAAIRPAQSYTEPYICLEKNPIYYDAASVAITQVTALVLSEDEAWARYQAGELDDITPPGSALDEIKASPVYNPQLRVFP